MASGLESMRSIRFHYECTTYPPVNDPALSFTHELVGKARNLLQGKEERSEARDRSTV